MAIIYRAVSEAEKIDLEEHKKFRAKQGAYEGKLFAESDKDATTFGKEFYYIDGNPIYIVKVRVSEEFEKNLGIVAPDQFLGVGFTFSVDGEKMDLFNNNMTFEILNHTTNA